MIRPIDYCETPDHFSSSILTIEQRIEELQTLRKQYIQKFQTLTATVNLTAVEQPQESIYNEQK
ncbi:hypothetical protein ACL9RF_10320 [Sphingobacterium sp. Mn56C]|uniref:hypothetical protein n=1 Tax=Sphingobacterium sp. Mn56C TaxID=3395261 RepID=UPI003BE436B1